MPILLLYPSYLLPFFILSSKVDFLYIIPKRNYKLLFKNFDFYNRRESGENSFFLIR
jgi:hypothetical protein